MTVELERAIASQVQALERVSSLAVEEPVELLRRASRIWLVGTGTSQHAAELGALLLADVGVDARAAGSLHFSQWLPAVGKDEAVVIISHTGETALARAARSRAEAGGAAVVSITAQGADWPHAIETVPRERSETYTVSYTAAVVVLGRLAALLSGDELLAGQIAALPAHVQAALDDPRVESIASPERLLVYAGVGPGAITAREGALKAREAARLAAEGFDAEYLLHGTAVPLDERDRLILLAPSMDRTGLLEGVGRAAEAEGVAVSRIDSPVSLNPVLAQMPLTISVQRLALRWARERGQDADLAIVGAWADEALWSLGSPSD